MDDDSEEDVGYRHKTYSSKRESSNSGANISEDEDEDDVELNIKPPQAKIMRHSSHYRYSDNPASSRKVYVSSNHHRKSHHSRKHHDERHFNDRQDVDVKPSRSVYKDYENLRREYDDQKRRQFYDRHPRDEKMRERYEERLRYEEKMKEQKSRYDEKAKEEKFRYEEKVKEQKSRYDEKVKEDKYKYEEEFRSDVRYANEEPPKREERRKHHHHRHRHRHQQEYEQDIEQTYKKKHSVRDVLEVDEGRKRHELEETRERSSHKHRHAREKRSPVTEKQRQTVIDVEMSPPVYKDSEEEYLQDSDVTEGKEGDDTELREEKDLSEDGSSGSGSSDSSEDSSSDSSSSSDDASGSSSSVEEVPEQPVKEPSPVEEEPLPEPEREETPPLTVATNDYVDNEIELEKDTLPAYFPAIQGCRSVEEFLILNRIEEGTYGVVYRAKEKKTDTIVALKRLKMEKEKDGFPITSLREINTLLKAQHPNIVTVKEIVVGSNMDRIFIVMDYVEHDLKSLMEIMKKKKATFMVCEVKCLMQQLLRAVDHLHDNWILHRDLKTSNLLFSNGGVLKVGDFGLAREYGSPLKHYTPVVVTLWYRAPELLLGSKEYSTSIDMWSVGCIFAELLAMEPLFPGKTETNQIYRIFKDLGTPSEKVWPDFTKLPLAQISVFPKFPPNGLRPKFNGLLSKVGYELLLGFLTYDPKARITAENALGHEYFDESPLPIEPTMFPSWPSKSDPKGT